MLIFEDTTFGSQKCELNLLELYPNKDKRLDFQKRFDSFIESGTSNPWIFCLRDNILRYKSEVFVSDKCDDRPPLLLLLGNPASHSVEAGMCFAYEKGGGEHRYWKILNDTGILTFVDQSPLSENYHITNEMKRNALSELNYLSPFRIGIAVFYSLPTSASDPKWSGVNGVKRLLGAKAFETISIEEERRIDGLISKFLGDQGGIIAFQKDAYNRLRSEDTPAYSIDLSNQGLLMGKYKRSKNILLAGSPSTRLIQSVDGKSALLKFKDWLYQSYQ